MQTVACFAAAPPPVAWLEGDVLAEYLLFLEETASPPPPARVPVAWLEGQVCDEFLRFLEESRAVAAAAVDPERQEEEHCGGLVVDGDHRSFADAEGGFMEDDASAMELEEDESGDGGVCAEKGEQEAEAVLELLLPHILDLPAFRSRAPAPAPVQQEPVLGFSCYRGGWLQNWVSLIEARRIAAARLLALTKR
uniref:Uncharacterized protein n=1 Tax=Setaria viridis TaxID=4556 RepID=A0A4U6VQD8_SETVI|nr:hypothetical protein SEVIR_2G079100v2 [Setaria viridis]